MAVGIHKAHQWFTGGFVGIVAFWLTIHLGNIGTNQGIYYAWPIIEKEGRSMNEIMSGLAQLGAVGLVLAYMIWKDRARMVIDAKLQTDLVERVRALEDGYREKLEGVIDKMHDALDEMRAALNENTKAMIRLAFVIDKCPAQTRDQEEALARRIHRETEGHT